jgi:hypothetical protein
MQLLRRIIAMPSQGREAIAERKSEYCVCFEEKEVKVNLADFVIFIF